MSNKAYRYGEQWPIIAKRLTTLAISPSHLGELTKYGQFALDNRSTYEAISAKTNGFPWELAAAFHRRESDGDFGTYLGNGDSLLHPTRNVPAGRGPFLPHPDREPPRGNFIRGGIDAIEYEGFQKIVGPWPIEKMIFYAEPFNGLGYFNRGIPSPYVWGFTSVQQIGKYVGDGQWDPTHWDTQPGIAAILWMIGYLDPANTHYTRET